MEKNKKNDVIAKRLRSETEQGLQSRREFFKSAAKAALPVIGAILLTQVTPTSALAATQCDGCSGACVDTCMGSCMGSCRGSCDSSCKGTCEGSCKEGCGDKCNY